MKLSRSQYRFIPGSRIIRYDRAAAIASSIVAPQPYKQAD